MFRFIKQVFLALLSFDSLLAAKCLSLKSQPCIARPILIDRNPDELLYYRFVVSLDRCDGACNTLDDLPAIIFNLSDKKFVPNKTKDVKLKYLIHTTSINESKTLIKHISCGCTCKFKDRKLY